MADKALSTLTAGTTPLDGTELFYVVQGSDSRKVAGSDVVKIAHTQAFSSITSLPTTLSGYGITDAQAKSSKLTAIAGLSSSDSGFIVGDGSTWTVESGSTARASLGLAIGSDVQAYSADLVAIAGLDKDDGGVIIGDGTSWTLESGATLRTSLGLSIGSDVQAYDASLNSVSGLTLNSGDILYSTGPNAFTNLPKGADGQVLVLSSGLPSWANVAGTGDMISAVYDPDGTGANAFDQDNMVDGTTNKNYTATEKTKLSGIEALADVTDATNVAAAGAAMASNNLSDVASIPTSAANLGVIRDAVKIYAANGDGVTANDTAFGNANTAGGLIFIPKPATGYAFTSDFATTAAAWLPDPSTTWDKLTDGGKLSLYRGHFSNGTNGANMWRFSDRVFIGEAASKWAGENVLVGGIFSKDAGTSWFGEAANGPAYLAVGASLVVIAPENADSGLRNGGCFAARSSDASAVGSIALSAHVENTRTLGNSASWATYFSAAHKSGVSGSSRYTYANETETVDSSGVSIPVASPYAVDTGAMGFWIHCGGGGAYGETPTRPSVNAITIGRGGASGLGFVVGINFMFSGIYGTDGSAASTTYGDAMKLARHHKITWSEPGTKTEGASIVSRVTVAASKVALTFEDNNVYVRGANTNPICAFTYAASTQNWIIIGSNSTGSAPFVQGSGADTNVDLRLRGKGTGVIRYGTHTAIGAETVTGYITIKDDGGTSRKLAVVS